MMTVRQLGESDLHITRIGIGAWAIGGGNGSLVGVRKTMRTPSKPSMQASLRE